MIMPVTYREVYLVIVDRTQQGIVTASESEKANFQRCFPTFMYFKKIPRVMLEWGFQFSRSRWGLESKFLTNCKGVLILGTAPFSSKDLEACNRVLFI